MINSAEHKIYPANANILTFIMIMNTPFEMFKARNFFEVLVLMSSWKFVLSWVEYEKSFITLETGHKWAVTRDSNNVVFWQV